MDLHIKQVDTSINNFNPSFYANAVVNASYQWLDCNDGFALIVGEIGQGFTAIENGSYAVEVSQNGCVDTVLFSVSTPLDINISLSESPVNCYGGNDGEIYSFNVTFFKGVIPRISEYIVGG